MTRSRRLLLIVVLLLVVGGGAVYLGARRLLSSKEVADQVARRLADVYGAPVGISEVDIGLTGTALQRLELFEDQADAAKATPWLTVRDVDTDVSAWRLVRGDTNPRRLALHAAAVTLRFDEHGHLLTRIPSGKSTGGSFPDLDIDGSDITLSQQGRPAMHITGVKGDTHAEGNDLVLSGNIDDPYWGQWSLQGRIDPKAGDGTFTLKTEHADVTQEKLDALPFVPASVWQEVHAQGKAAIELTLRWGTKQGGLHYKVVVRPDDATISATTADLQVVHTQGEIVVDDDRVMLNKMHGKTLGGEVQTTSDMDFGATPEKLHFQVTVKDLNLDRIPASWPVPRKLGQAELGGRLEGSADLEVTLSAGQVSTHGGGTGRIVHPRLGGIDLRSKPMEFTITANGTQFSHSAPRQVSQLPVDESVMALAVLLLAPQAEPATVFGAWAELPSRVAGLVESNVSRVATAITQTGRKVATCLPGQSRTPPAPGQPPNYLDLDFGLEDVDLAQLIKGLKLQFPYEISGRLTFQVHASMPVDSPGDMKTYRLNGTASLSQFTVSGLTLENVRARVTLAEGILRLDELSGRVPAEARGSAPTTAGTFSGTARVAIAPPGDFSAHLTLEKISVARVLTLVPSAAETVKGLVSAQVDVRAPMARLADLTTWTASGSLTADRLEAYGLALEQVDAGIRLERGLATLTRAGAKLQGAKLSATGDIRLEKAYAYHAKVELEPLDLASLQRLVPDLRPPVPISGRFQAGASVEGNLNPMTVKLSGSGAGSDLTVDDIKIASLKFNWSTAGDKLTLSDVQAKLYEGRLTGSGVVPLKADEPGSVAIQFEGVDVGKLAKDLPATPIKLDGKAGGSVEGKLTAAKPTREFSGKLALEAPRLRVQGIPTERLTGNVDYKKGGVDYHFEGQTLGGRFHLDGKLPTAAPKPAGPPAEGRLQVEGARLSRLGDAFGARSTLGPLRGVLDLDIRFHHQGANLEPVGRGQVMVRGLRWGDSLLADSLRGDLLLSEEELRLRDLTGSLGQGLLRAQMAYNLKQPDRSWFNITLQSVDAAAVLAPWPGLAGKVTGPLDASLRGRFGREWLGSGEIALARGKVMGIDVADWRLPIDFAFGPLYGNGQIDIREGSGLVAEGRVNVHATLLLGSSSHVEGQLRFTDVDLPTLLRQAADTSQVGAGKLSGRIDFGGSDVHSLNDVTATIQASMRQAQVLQMPVLQQVAPFVAPGQGSALFNSGELRARLAGGTVRVQSLEVSGNVLKLFVEGTVTTEGRLALEVTASTGVVAPSVGALSLLRLRLPVTGPIPVGLLTQASNSLSLSVIHLTVLGTVRDPIIQVQPLRLLTDEAVRFFVFRGLLPVP